MEKKALRGLLLFGLFLMPITIRRERTKEWVIIFFFKGILSSILDTFLTRNNKVSYPKRLLPNYFKINILFDYLLFPISCVVYNQVTYHSKPIGIIIKAGLFSLPLTILEVMFEKNTRLIKFKNGWTWGHTFISEMITFICSRLFIEFLRKYSK